VVGGKGPVGVAVGVAGRWKGMVGGGDKGKGLSHFPEHLETAYMYIDFF
jgi:hypothetical protein